MLHIANTALQIHSRMKSGLPRAMCATHVKHKHTLLVKGDMHSVWNLAFSPSILLVPKIHLQVVGVSPHGLTRLVQSGIYIQWNTI